MKIVPARNGVAWLARGFALFRRNPPAWLALAFAYWLAAALLAQIPYAGHALSIVLLPPVTMIFLTLCRDLEAGSAVRAGALVDAFRARFRDLATLGLLNFACFMLVLALASLADGSVLDLALGARDPSQEPPAGAAAARADLVAIAASLPVMFAFWFATPLAGWGGMGPLQSLFYSFFAAFRNWRAFVVYVAALIGVGVVLLTALGMVAAITRQSEIVWYALLLAMILLMPIGLASSYASYRDVFPEGRTGPLAPG